MEKLNRIPAFLLMCLVVLAERGYPLRAVRLTLSGCVKGPGCSQCPDSYYTKTSDGSLLCCPKCSSAALYYGEFPSSWCVCYSDASMENDVEARTVRFPGPSTLQNIPSTSGGTGVLDTQQALPAGDFLKDALYIINHGVHVGSSSGSSGVSRAVQQALTLMAETMEDLHARVLRLEDLVLRRPVGHLPSASVDRVGTGSTPPLSSEESCSATNFTRIGDACYYVSTLGDGRSVWKEAKDSCEVMGAKLAEPIRRSELIDLTQYLSLAPSTTGFSYWIGGVYPGLSWLWVYEGKEVTLRSSYWTGVDSSGRKVDPGDVTPGRCLTLTYLVEAGRYYYAADECGYQKYYICELLDKTRRGF